MLGAIVNTKNKFFGPNGSRMGRIDMSNPNRRSPTQSQKAQAHDNQPIKRSSDISEILKFVKAVSKEYFDFVSNVKYEGDFFSKQGHDRIREQWWKVIW